VRIRATSNRRESAVITRIVLIFLFMSALAVSPGIAQEICLHTVTKGFSPLTPEFRHVQRIDVPEPDGTKPGDRGYRHQSLHERGIIRELMDKTGNTCCSGIDSPNPECRVSHVDRVHNRVLIDGVWCPMSTTTKIATVTGLLPGENAVVCAGRSSGRENENPCPPAYCVGQRADFY